MAKTLTERQMDFRAARKAEGGMRLDMWLQSAEAAKLKQLMTWRAKKSSAQVILDLINEEWRKEVVEAAEQGHADAQFEYAYLLFREYKRGQDQTVKTANIIEAEHWLSESLEQEYRESAGCNNMGIISLIWGDESFAAEWFELSADAGSRVALYNRGMLGMVGREVREPYYGQVFEWFLQSAEQGYSLAQMMVGILYAIGKGVPRNYDKAIEWMRRATGDDDMDCEYTLALLLSTIPHDGECIRDGQIAVTIAERLVRSGESLIYLTALAAAYAEAERFEDAIKTIKKARLKLRRGRPSENQDGLLKHCDYALTRYTAKKPWRSAEAALRYYWDLGDVSDGY